MLIVIVVTAAVALAAFVASYQKQLQAEDAHNHLVSLESIRVVGIASSLNTSETGFATLAFTIASSDVNPTSVTGITLNGGPLRNYSASDLDTPSTPPTFVAIGGSLVLAPDEEATINLNLTPGDPDFSFLSWAYIPTPFSYLTIDVYTFLGNKFEASYVPPTAVAYISSLSTYNGSGYVQVPLFVGSDSFQPGGNATIVSWIWTVTPEPPTTPYSLPAPPSLSGEDVEPAVGTYFANHGTYNVTLAVTSSDGLIGTTTVQYTEPSS